MLILRPCCRFDLKFDKKQICSEMSEVSLKANETQRMVVLILNRNKHIDTNHRQKSIFSIKKVTKKAARFNVAIFLISL